jgi:chemotaxis protein MotB
LKRERHTTLEEPPKVPAYIVTYSDMTTLLLTFFVMLLSLASVQDPELFNMGRGSFIQSVRGLGLGMLYGRKPRPDFGHTKIKYFISTPDKPLLTRTIDAKEEELRRIFQKVNRSMTTMPSQIVAERTNFSVTNIRFSPGESRLDESAKKFLKEFCLGLQQNADSKTGTLYVLGLADEPAEGGMDPAQSFAPAGKEQWILSARRAQAVADFLGTVLSARGGWRIYSWGAGPGGDWVGQDSPISKQSQILIAVLSTSD